MVTAFLDGEIWPRLTGAVRASQRPCMAAVAYAGQDAAKMLPLPRGSTLVVDASEAVVKAGQTDPHSLLKLINRGVRVFSQPGLHAKVFVVGRRAFIGSNNVSGHSANSLIEAAIVTSEPNAVTRAKEFIRAQCAQQLTPRQVKELAKLYQPPRIAGRDKGTKTGQPPGPRVHLAKLEIVNLSPAEEKEHKRQLEHANKKRKHPRSYRVDSFFVRGRCRYEINDVIVQVLRVRKGKFLISAPGNLIHIKRDQTSLHSLTHVYVERPRSRQRDLKAFAKRLGPGALKRLRTDGVVRNRAFARELLLAWHNR